MEQSKKSSNLDKTSHLAHDAINTVTNATYQVATKIVDKGDELHQVANKIVEKGDELNNLAHDTINKATTATHEAIDKLTEKKEELINAEQEMIMRYSTYVRDNPKTAIGIAAGVGYLISKFLNNR